MPIENFEDILFYSELVVIGEVIDGGTENDIKVYNMASDGNENFMEKFGIYPTESVTFTEFKITNIVNGELDDDVITDGRTKSSGKDKAILEFENQDPENIL